MPLHEREPHLQALLDATAAASAGRGCTVLITGEAGIGKTALVEQFTSKVADRARVLWGACEALFTPRPLGPFYDIAHTLGGPLRLQLQNDAKPIDLFHGLLENVRRHAKPSVIVLEDVHWADHATLDFIRFLARRIDKAPGLLVLTFRDDEVGADHPLTAVLGDLPASTRTRLKLPALSRATVETMAKDAGGATRDLYRITGGNPFFVTEALRERDAVLAPSVREAVLARANRLSSAAREVLDLVSIAPDRVELSLIEAALKDGIAAIEECIARSLLHVTEDHVAFRHELARLAIEEALPAIKRRRMNRTLVALLETRGDDVHIVTRLAHHSIAAGDAEAIVRHGPRAAALATARAAHREAAALLNAVMPHAVRLSIHERAALFEQRADACFVLWQSDEAIATYERAYALWKELGDTFAKGRNRVRCLEAIIMLRPTSWDALRAFAREAVELLEPLGPSDELALAYSANAVIQAQAGYASPACTASRDKALALRALSASPKVRVEVLTWIGASEYFAFGAPTLDNAHQLDREAREAGDDVGILASYFRQAAHHARERNIEALESSVAAGLAFAKDRELDQSFRLLLLRRCGCEALVGRCKWQEAEQAYRLLGAERGTPPWMRRVSCIPQVALLRARQGNPVDRSALEEVLRSRENMISSDVFNAEYALAEIFWLCGERDLALDSARRAYEVARNWRHPWAMGDAAFWTWVSGGIDGLPDGVAEPYRLQFAGAWRDAMAAWRNKGCEYEAALAGLFGGEEGMHAALHALEAIGARGTAYRVREHMRAAGVAVVPRGPLASTRANSFGLTDREEQVLALLAEDLSNSEIATRVHRSIRTVEHQVAAVIGKLGARSRHDAVAIAKKQGLVQARPA